MIARHACGFLQKGFHDMRFPFLTAPLLALSFAAPAGAEIAPGLWSYQAQYALGPVPMKDSGTYCVDPDMASRSLDALFNEINDNCKIASSEGGVAGYKFTLVCQGGPDGALDGRLQVGNGEAALSASGWTGTAQENVPVLLQATARRLGPSC